MKDNEKIKILSFIMSIIFFSIMLSSTLLFINSLEKGAGSSHIKTTKGLIAKEYYLSRSFDKYLIPSIAKSLETSVSSHNSDKSIERARLSSINNIHYFSINKYTGEVYTNTDYKTEKEFRYYMDDYCNVQITNGGRGYIKNIGNNKIEDYNTDNNRFNISSKNMYVYMSFPKTLTEGDEVYESYYYYQKYKSVSEISLLVIIVSIILFIISSLIYAKNESSIHRCKVNTPIELEIMILIFSAAFILKNLNFITIYKTVIITLNISIDIVISIMVMEKCQSNGGISNVLKRCFINQYIKQSIYRFKLVIKEILLLKKILVAGIIAIIFNILGYYLDIVYGKFIFAFLFSTLSITLIIIYLIIKLSYINHIMNSTNKIKNGRYDYKIKIKGNDNFTQLAENINGMGENQNRVVEEKLMNEKIKLKLIYNIAISIKRNVESLNIDSQILDVQLDELLELSNQNEINKEMINTNLINIINKKIYDKKGNNTQKNLDIILNIVDENMFINYSENRINKIIDKILDNVYKYSLDNTRVYIDIYKEDEKVKLVIKNISSSKINFSNSEVNANLDDKSMTQLMKSNSITLLEISHLIKSQGGDMKIDIDGDLFKLSIVF